MRLLRFLVLASASCFGILFFSPAVTPAQQTATITGTLTDQAEAAIVGAALVTAQPLGRHGGECSRGKRARRKVFADTKSWTIPRNR